MSVIEASSASQLTQLPRQHKRLFVFYGSASCPGCQDITPLYHRIAKRYSGEAVFVHADIDKLSLMFTSLPVFVFFYQGERKDTIVGASSERLKGFIGQGLKFAQ